MRVHADDRCRTMGVTAHQRAIALSRPGVHASTRVSSVRSTAFARGDRGKWTTGRDVVGPTSTREPVPGVRTFTRSGLRA